MSYVNIWVHVVFCTKSREKVLTEKVSLELYNFIRNYCLSKNIYLDSISGFTDHIHLLLSLGKTQQIAKVLQLIKGSSAFYLNQTNVLSRKFQWQDDYYAMSVSQSQVEKVRRYISMQMEHHRYKSFEEEISVWKEKHGWK